MPGGRLRQADLPNLQVEIAVGASKSNVLPWQVIASDAESVTIQAPAALDAVTYTYEVSQDGVTYATLQDAASVNIPVPAAGKAIIYNGVLVGFNYLRISSSGASAAIRTFKLTKTFRV